MVENMGWNRLWFSFFSHFIDKTGVISSTTGVISFINIASQQEQQTVKIKHPIIKMELVKEVSFQVQKNNKKDINLCFSVFIGNDPRRGLLESVIGTRNIYK
jgi:hypothetical protein